MSARPAEEIEHLAPLVAYIAKRVEAAGIDGARISPAESPAALAKGMEEGRVDLYIGGPLTALMVAQLSRSQARIECTGAHMRGIIFAKKGSGIGGLEDLAGRVVAFSTRYASFGSVLPRIVLESKGARLRLLDAPSAVTAEGQVGYVFSGAAENTILWVLRGKVAAGAMSSGEFSRLARGNRGRFDIVHKTGELPALLVVPRASMPSGLLSRLVNAFTVMFKEKEGRHILQSMAGVASCQPLTEEGRAPLDALRPLITRELGDGHD